MLILGFRNSFVSRKHIKTSELWISLSLKNVKHTLFSEQPSLILCFIEVQEESMVENIILKLNLIVVEKTQLISKYEFIKNCFVPLYFFSLKLRAHSLDLGYWLPSSCFQLEGLSLCMGQGAGCHFQHVFQWFILSLLPVTGQTNQMWLHTSHLRKVPLLTLFNKGNRQRWVR